MSTVIHNTNKACCSIPPVQAQYTPLGSFKSLGDFDKVYVTGPESSDNAIVCVYDIFGSAFFFLSFLFLHTVLQVLPTNTAGRGHRRYMSQDKGVHA